MKKKTKFARFLNHVKAATINKVITSLYTIICSFCQIKCF